MVSRKTAQRQDEFSDEAREGGRTGRIVAAVALYGVALLLAYVTLAAPVDGTAMGAIRGALVGLGGSCAILIPCMFAWVATLLAMSAAEKKLSAWRCAVDGVLFLCAFTAAQLFVAETVIAKRMTISGFANFVDKSYGYGGGGGAIGALLAWPLYVYLGKWGGLLGALLLALLSLTATGRAGRFVRWSRDRLQSARHGHEQRRMVRDNERMFDVGDPAFERRPAAPAAAEGRAARRPPANGGLAGEELIRGAGGRSRRREPSLDGNPAFVRDERTGGARPRADRAATRPASGRRDESLLDDAPLEMAGNDAPSMTPFEKKGRGKRREGFQPDTPPSVEAMRRRREAASGAQEAPVGDASAPNGRRSAEGRKSAEAFEEASAPNGRRSAEGRKSAEAFEEASAPSGRRSAEGRKSAEAFEEASAPSGRRNAEGRKSTETFEEAARAAEGDLEIEPEVCDVIEPDEPPFDVPGRPKKPLGKLKRPAPAPEEEEDYNYPPIDLLSEGEAVKENHREADMEKARLLEETLQQFGISTKLTGIAHGPAVTRFELAPAPGVKVSRITSLSDDIAMHLAAMSVRIEAPIPGKAAVGVEIPNEKVEMVRLRDVLESAEARKSPSKIAVGLGQGQLRALHRGRHRQDAARADRRPDRLRQVGVHQFDHHVDPLPRRAGRGAADPDRPEGRRAVHLQRHPAPDLPGGDGLQEGGERAGVGRRGDVHALQALRRARRARHQGLQQGAARGRKADAADGDHHRRAGRFDDGCAGRRRGQHLPAGAAGARGGDAPRHRHAAALRQRHYRHHQGEHPDAHRVLGRLAGGQPHDDRPRRRGKAARQRRYAVRPLGHQQADARAGRVGVRRGSPRGGGLHQAALEHRLRRGHDRADGERRPQRRREGGDRGGIRPEAAQRRWRSSSRRDRRRFRCCSAGCASATPAPAA